MLLGGLEHWLSSTIEEKPVGIYKKQEILMVLLELQSNLDKGYSVLKLHKLTYIFNCHQSIMQVLWETDAKTRSDGQEVCYRKCLWEN